jgi:hypothetical protein
MNVSIGKQLTRRRGSLAAALAAPLIATVLSGCPGSSNGSIPGPTTSNAPSGTLCGATADIAGYLNQMVNGPIENQPPVMQAMSQLLNSLTGGNAQQTADRSSLLQDVSAIDSSGETGNAEAQSSVTAGVSDMYNTLDSIEANCT